MEHREIKQDLGRWQLMAWVVGLAGAAASVYGYTANHDGFFQSYLMAYWYWFCLGAGGLGLLLLHHLVGGHWGFVIQRPLEAAARTMPLLAVLFVPVVLGMHALYRWTDPAHINHVLEKKQAYLNPTAFIMRAVIFFLIWSVLAYLLSSWSRRQDAEPDPTRTNEKLRLLSGPGLVAFVLCMTFAGIDWGMSLTPEWFSTMYGPLFIVGAGLSTFAFMALLASRFDHRNPYIHALSHQQFHDIGNLMFAFTILWSYMSIGEYIIIWSGNLKEETEWFLHRQHGGWTPISIALAIGQFAIPFFVLLNKPVKRHARFLAPVAVWVLVFRYIGVYWMVAPTFRDHLSFHWMDAATLLGVGGIWLGVFFGQLKKMNLLPDGDPRFKEKLAHHAVGHP